MLIVVKRKSTTKSIEIISMNGWEVVFVFWWSFWWFLGLAKINVPVRQNVPTLLARVFASDLRENVCGLVDEVDVDRRGGAWLVVYVRDGKSERQACRTYAHTVITAAGVE